MSFIAFVIAYRVVFEALGVAVRIPCLKNLREIVIELIARSIEALNCFTERVVWFRDGRFASSTSASKGSLDIYSHECWRGIRVLGKLKYAVGLELWESYRNRSFCHFPVVD